MRWVDVPFMDGSRPIAAGFKEGTSPNPRQRDADEERLTDGA
jgi:hypothetical protein